MRRKDNLLIRLYRFSYQNIIIGANVPVPYMKQVSFLISKS